MSYLFLPGYACDQRAFLELKRILPDSYGFNYEPEMTFKCSNFLEFCDYTYESNKELFNDVLVLVGHSMGTAVAFELTENYSKLKRKRIISLDYFYPYQDHFLEIIVQRKLRKTYQMKLIIY